MNGAAARDRGAGCGHRAEVTPVLPNGVVVVVGVK
jgi:hypothetical protein